MYSASGFAASSVAWSSCCAASLSVSRVFCLKRVTAAATFLWAILAASVRFHFCIQNRARFVAMRRLISASWAVTSFPSSVASMYNFAWSSMLSSMLLHLRVMKFFSSSSTTPCLTFASCMSLNTVVALCCRDSSDGPASGASFLSFVAVSARCHSSIAFSSANSVVSDCFRSASNLASSVSSFSLRAVVSASFTCPPLTGPSSGGLPSLSSVAGFSCLLWPAFSSIPTCSLSWAPLLGGSLCLLTCGRIFPFCRLFLPARLVFLVLCRIFLPARLTFLFSRWHLVAVRSPPVAKGTRAFHSLMSPLMFSHIVAIVPSLPASAPSLSATSCVVGGPSSWRFFLSFWFCLLFARLAFFLSCRCFAPARLAFFLSRWDLVSVFPTSVTESTRAVQSAMRLLNFSHVVAGGSSLSASDSSCDATSCVVGAPRPERPVFTH